MAIEAGEFTPSRRRSRINAQRRLWNSRRAGVFASHAMFVFPQQFAPDHIAIFRHDAHEPVVVLGMIPDEFRQALHLPLHRSSRHTISIIGLAGSIAGFMTAGRAFCFFMSAPSLRPDPVGLHVDRSIIRVGVEVNHSASFLFPLRPATIGASMAKIFTMVLAGGKGERLQPSPTSAQNLRSLRRKISHHRFHLSNCLNSGLRRQMAVLISTNHIPSTGISGRDGIFSIPNSANTSSRFRPAADQRRVVSRDRRCGLSEPVPDGQRPPEFLLVLAGDHIYKMNYADMYNLLIEKQADAIVGAIETRMADANRFGVIAVDEDRRILSFDEKPEIRCTFPAIRLRPSSPWASICSARMSSANN